ncbi:GumC family protein [Neorhodopirellula pilleata]|uniref:Chain length determinant protein n=1 Tax=Neorhodopirellula pilleata TaxID=2714738 RepID=A0A5C5ZZT8_9BACT|nr:exopolysaccharide biosynthesis protein [Neorhodopirellula pilleata]TWT92541.1 Chain length determinant protein [Neorhodopirellula pilleata]
MSHIETESWAMVTPGDVLRSIRRRIPSVIFTTILVTTAVVSILVIWPNHYRSEGMMYVRLGRGALGGDPTAKTNNSVSMQESRTAEVVSIGEMIGSREIAERAVERVGVEKINQPRNWIEEFSQLAGAKMKELDWLTGSQEKTVGDLTPQQYDAQLEREKAIKTVQKAINIQVAKNGYTVAVAGKEDDPLLIQSIVQAVMDEFGSYHVEAHRVKGSEAFFDVQARESRELAIAARRELQETRNKMGWLSADAAERTLSERIIDLEMKLSSADSELAEAISQAEELRRQLESTDQWVPVAKTLGIANAAGDQMRSQLYDVQIQDGEELAKLSPSHPRYKRIEAKMNQSEQLAEVERSEREERQEAINPVYQELETQFQTVRAKAVGLASRRDSIVERLEATQADLQRLNEDVVVMSRLDWEAQIAEDTYRSHARSLEEARVNAELDKNLMSDVSVIQGATLNLKKAGPQRALLSVVGALFALSLGLLQAILRDSPTSSVRRTESRRNRQTADSADQDSRTFRTEMEHDALAPQQRTKRQARSAVATVPTITATDELPGSDSAEIGLTKFESGSNSPSSSILSDDESIDGFSSARPR